MLNAKLKSGLAGPYPVIGRASIAERPDPKILTAALQARKRSDGTLFPPAVCLPKDDEHPRRDKYFLEFGRCSIAMICRSAAPSKREDGFGEPRIVGVSVTRKRSMPAIGVRARDTVVKLTTHAVEVNLQPRLIAPGVFQKAECGLPSATLRMSV